MPGVVVGRDDEDMKKFGTQGAVLLGKHIVSSGEEAHLTTPVMLDVLRPHVIALTGKRGSGKSFSLGVIAEEIAKLPDDIRKNLCCLVVDTQGIFWTMKSPNEKELSLLNAWGMKPRGFDARVYVPEGQSDAFSQAGVDFDAVFSVAAEELSAEDWVGVFGIDPNEPLGILIYMALRRGRKDIDGIISAIKGIEGFEKEKLNLQNYFEAAKAWGIFGRHAMPKILEPGKITVLDVSLTPQNVRSLLLSIACRKIFEERTAARRKEELAEIELTPAEKMPMPWILIDEAHNFLPESGTTPAADMLSRIVKEGRQPGITLVLATQRPEKLNPDALAQCDLIISHRLTAKQDIEALGSIMQTYMLYEIGKYIAELPNVKGAAIILDDNSERIYKVRIRPRQSWHAGASPVAI